MQGTPNNIGGVRGCLLLAIVSSVLAIVSTCFRGMWSPGHSPWSTTLRGHLATHSDTNRRSVTGRTGVRGGVPRRRGVCICIGVWLCSHFCGGGGRREGGGGLCRGWGLVFVPPGFMGWVYVVGFWLTFGSGGERLATRFHSPPKFSFTPEPVCLDTKRRRQSTVPFSGHCPMRSGDAAQAVVCVEESTRLGSVFVGCCVRLST